MATPPQAETQKSGHFARDVNDMEEQRDSIALKLKHRQLQAERERAEWVELVDALSCRIEAMERAHDVALTAALRERNEALVMLVHQQTVTGELEKALAETRTRLDEASAALLQQQVISGDLDKTLVEARTTWLWCFREWARTVRSRRNQS